MKNSFFILGVILFSSLFSMKKEDQENLKENGTFWKRNKISLGLMAAGGSLGGFARFLQNKGKKSFYALGGTLAAMGAAKLAYDTYKSKHEIVEPSGDD